jgi:ribosome biogenesis protein ENP2
MDQMGLGHLVGTPLLRAYMHGYFVDNRLYRKAANLAQPFAYETYRQQQIDAKLEAARESRISIVRKLPKVLP